MAIEHYRFTFEAKDKEGNVYEVEVTEVFSEIVTLSPTNQRFFHYWVNGVQLTGTESKNVFILRIPEQPDVYLKLDDPRLA